ncbi:MAG: DUF4142 domain-containing protein [Burkholderiaceae bacterium]
MRLRPLLLAAGLALMCLHAGPAAAADALDHADASFLREAAQAGHAEVEGSKLALQKSSNTQVKGFAQQIIDDHTKAGQDLAALASSKGVELPDGPSVAQTAKLKLLSMSDGAKFDARYAQTIGVDAHRDAVKLFSKASTSAKDAEVKAFAGRTLPTLQQHLQAAQELQRSTGRK